MRLGTLAWDENRCISRQNFHKVGVWGVGARQSRAPHPRHLARILAYDLLVLDDFGLESISPQAVQDLYEIITERYEHGSLIITSNRGFEEWGEIFANDLPASAALDRLTHHAHTIVIRGDSLRQRSRRKESSLPETSPKQSEISTAATTAAERNLSRIIQFLKPL